MHKITPVALSYLFVLLVACGPNQEVIDLSPKIPVSEVESCNFRVELLLPKGRLTEELETKVVELMFKTLEKFINTGEFGAVAFVSPGGAVSGYMYLDLQEPCLESSRKVGEFIKTYNSYAQKDGKVKIMLGAPEPLAPQTPLGA